jgi:hypothetical protein
MVMKATGNAQPYSHFAGGFSGRAAKPLPKGDTGFTSSASAKRHWGPGGHGLSSRLRHRSWLRGAVRHPASVVAPDPPDRHQPAPWQRRVIEHCHRRCHSGPTCADRRAPIVDKIQENRHRVPRIARLPPEGADPAAGGPQAHRAFRRGLSPASPVLRRKDVLCSTRGRAAPGSGRRLRRHDCWRRTAGLANIIHGADRAGCINFPSAALKSFWTTCSAARIFSSRFTAE